MTAMRRLPARVLICTAKPAHFALPIMRHFGLEPHCDAIYGPELDGRLDDKGDLIAHMLEAERFDPRQTVMIGDRGSDMIAASRHGIAGVGVLWGYGDADELSKAGAAVLCADPRELVASATSLLRGR